MTNEKEKERRRLIILVIFTAIFLAFLITQLIVKELTYSTAFIFGAMTLVSFNFLIAWKQIPKAKPKRRLFGVVQKDWGIDLLWGIGVGLIVLVVMQFIPALTIAVPSMPTSSVFPDFFATAGQYLTVAVIAPLVEEVFFRVVLFSLFFVILGWAFLPSALLTNLIFSFFHINAYAGEIALSSILSVSSAFLAAFIAGMLFTFVVNKRGSITAGIGAHGALNTAIILPQAIAF